MRPILPILALLGMALISARSADIALSDGRVFHQAEVTERDDAFITIRHAEGVATVPISLFPPEVKKAIGYDPLKAARRLGEEKRRLAAEEAERARRARAERIDQRKIFITGIFREQQADGYGVMDATRYGETQDKYEKFEPAPLGETWKPKKTEIVKTVTRVIKMDGILVAGLPKELKPGQSWSGNVWPAGESQIKNDKGMVRGMLTRYATSPQLAAYLIEEERRKATDAFQKRK